MQRHRGHLCNGSGQHFPSGHLSNLTCQGWVYGVKGQGLVSARMMNDIVRVMPSGKITVEFAGENATISAQRSQFTVPTLNAVEFPRTPAPSGEAVTITSADFKSALAQVVLAVFVLSQPMVIAWRCATFSAPVQHRKIRFSFLHAHCPNCNASSTCRKKSPFVSTTSMQRSSHRQ